MRAVPAAAVLALSLGAAALPPAGDDYVATIDAWHAKREAALAGVECSLWPIAEAGEALFIVFADATTGDGTYGAGRFLGAPAPDADGRVTVDFNRAVNPPCAFSPYATCPLPPEGNTLTVAVRAGERNWGEGH